MIIYPNTKLTGTQLLFMTAALAKSWTFSSENECHKTFSDTAHYLNIRDAIDTKFSFPYQQTTSFFSVPITKLWVVALIFSKIFENNGKSAEQTITNDFIFLVLL